MVQLMGVRKIPIRRMPVFGLMDKLRSLVLRKPLIMKGGKAHKRFNWLIDECKKEKHGVFSSRRTYEQAERKEDGKIVHRLCKKKVFEETAWHANGSALYRTRIARKLDGTLSMTRKHWNPDGTINSIITGTAGKVSVQPEQTFTPTWHFADFQVEITNYKNGKIVIVKRAAKMEKVLYKFLPSRVKAE